MSNVLGRAPVRNSVKVAGEIISNPSYSHEMLGERFYLADIAIKRMSERVDIIPLMLSEQLIDEGEDYVGTFAEAEGQFRSFMLHKDGGNRLGLTVFVKELSFSEHWPEGPEINQIYLDGYICKNPVYRRTPLGRDIADIFLAVNRPYGKCDYIPCVAWGRDARQAPGFSVSGKMRVWGRIQSRDYQKKINDAEEENRRVCEVSICRLIYNEPDVDISYVSC